MHRVTPDKIQFLRTEGKTVMHVLHPEKFESKGDDKKEKKATKKVAKKGGKGEDAKDMDKPEDNAPKYAEID